MSEMLAALYNGESFEIKRIERQDPGPGGATELDFNKAYNPPCTFSEFATCPIATPRNRLPAAIEAGERYAGY